MTGLTRARRLLTLDALGDIELIDVAGSAARAWARTRVHLAESGRRVDADDPWIAAVAASRGLPVLAQDEDVAPLEGVAGLEVIRV